MTENKQRAMAMAAASVLGLSVGMVALTAEADQTSNNQTSTQIKGETRQIKGETRQIKGETNALKMPTNQGSNQFKFWNTGTSNQHKIGAGSSTQIKGETNALKTPTNQGSNQGKFFTGGSNQLKGQVPSTELNPQPEPPKPDSQNKPK